jgi:hypothetical protein
MRQHQCTHNKRINAREYGKHAARPAYWLHTQAPHNAQHNQHSDNCRSTTDTMPIRWAIARAMVARMGGSGGQFLRKKTYFRRHGPVLSHGASAIPCIFRHSQRTPATRPAGGQAPIGPPLSVTFLPEFLSPNRFPHLGEKSPIVKSAAIYGVK